LFPLKVVKNLATVSMRAKSIPVNIQNFEVTPSPLVIPETHLISEASPRALAHALRY